MIILLSPAKTLDVSPIKDYPFTQPRLLEESKTLAQVLQEKSEQELRSLMKISDQLATLNRERYKQFMTPFTLANAKPALFTFKGDVYTDLKAEEFGKEDLQFANRHLRILSGLYGVLRPSDLMQAYRLEMGTRLRIKDSKNLYEFWDDKITDLLNEDVKNSKAKVFLNLASQEYMKAIKTDQLAAPLVHVHFKEWRNDKYKVIVFNAKKARGAMAHMIIKNKITDINGLYGLQVNGYLYDEGLSTENELWWVK